MDSGCGQFLQGFSNFAVCLIAVHSARGAHWFTTPGTDPDRSGQERIGAIEEPPRVRWREEPLCETRAR